MEGGDEALARSTRQRDGSVNQADRPEEFRATGQIPRDPGDPQPAAGGPGDAQPTSGGTITLYDVARMASVSTATVSRVVHGQDRVSESTRQRVLDVIDRLGYVPDGAAQSLSRRRKNVLGVVCVEHMGLAPQQYDIESMSLLFYDEVLR